MRPSRLAVSAVAVATLLGLTVTLGPAGSAGASAAAAPSAPYDVATITGPLGVSPLLSSLPPVTDDSNGTFSTAPNEIFVSATTYHFVVLPVGGGPVSTGHYGIGTSTGQLDFRLTAPPLDCASPTGGSVDIGEVAQAGDQSFTKLALEYTVVCTNGAAQDITYTGLLRYKSSVAYVAADATDPLDVGDGYQQVTTTAKTVTVTGRGPTAYHISGAATLTGANADSFLITDDSCDGATLAYGATCTVSIAARARATGALVAKLVLPDNSTNGERLVDLLANGVYSAVGKYVVGDPLRLLDTRTGNGAPKHPVLGGTSIHLAVGGRLGVPKTGVSAVVVNLTVTGPTSGGYVTAYPTGTTRPTVSNINFPKGWTGSNLVTVSPDATGRIDLYLSAGQANLVADLVGWYASTPTATTQGVPFRPILPPSRIADSRHDGGEHVPLASGYSREFGVSFNGITSSQVKAIVVNLTVTGVSKTGGYVTIYSAANGNYAWLNTSTVNPRAHEATPNLAIVPVVPCWRQWCQGSGFSTYRVYNGTGHPIDMIVDIVGLFSTTHNPGNATFRSLPAPTRIVDTRTALGTTALGAGTTHAVSPPSQVAAANTSTLVANITAVRPTVNTYLTAWPKATGFTRPTVSNLNPVAGRTVANAAAITVGDSEDFNLYNYAGHTDVLVDVVGTFENFPEVLPAGAHWAGANASRSSAQRSPATVTATAATGPAARAG